MVSVFIWSPFHSKLGPQFDKIRSHVASAGPFFSFLNLEAFLEPLDPSACRARISLCIEALEAKVADGLWTYGQTADSLF